MRKYIGIFVLIVSIIFIAAAVDGHAPGPKRTWLGVKVSDLSEKMLANLDLEYGVKIIRVMADSPAEASGLEKDDIILKFGDERVRDADDLVDMVRDTDAGERIEIEYLRNGDKNTVMVELDKRRFNRKERFYHVPSPEQIFIHDDGGAWLGIRSDNLTEQLRGFFGAPENMGVLISEVIEDGPAEKAGLQAGDIIIKLGSKKIKNTRSLMRAIDNYDPEDEVEIVVIREKSEKSITVELGETEKSRQWHFYGIAPHDFSFDIPDIKIEIPDIEVPEFYFNDEDLDIEIDVDDLHKRIQDKIEIKITQLNQKLNQLRQKTERLENSDI